jgi:hypothetical protein
MLHTAAYVKEVRFTTEIARIASPNAKIIINSFFIQILLFSSFMFRRLSVKELGN